MSVENLAARLDALDAGDAFVTEGEASVAASNLALAPTCELAELCSTLGWDVRIEDAAGSTWPLEGLDEAYAPFRLIIEKPAAPAGALRLLTNAGLAAWLGREDARAHWEVARLTTPFQSYAVSFTPWDVPAPAPATDGVARHARNFVRESAGQRLVPASLNRWLLVERNSFPHSDAAAAVWAAMSARMLMLALPDELDAEQPLLRFKGPPRLDLKLSAPARDLPAVFGKDGFVALQAAADWVFELDREAEMRHILLATELARCGGTGEIAESFIRDHIGDALASARTAYQVQLAGISSDALKTLSELRKSVSDDTAKVAEGTRQIITAVSGALAIGVGLIAARLAGTVNPMLVTVVMALAATYVLITVISGVLFTLLQRTVRQAWQPRLYRFLSKPDYDALVGRPARWAETALWLASVLGLVAIFLMALAIAAVNPRAAGKVALAQPVRPALTAKSDIASPERGGRSVEAGPSAAAAPALDASGPRR